MSAKTASSIEEYIVSFDGAQRQRLMQIQEVLKEVLPEAEQKISWGMPTYKLGKHNAFHFAGMKRHVSIFPSPYAVEHFSKKLVAYKTSKGTIQFQNHEPLPVELIRDIAEWRKRFMKSNPEKG